MAALSWLIGSTPGRLLIGAVAFFIWLQIHDAKIRTREQQTIASQQAKIALERVHIMEKNNANFRNLSDRDRCLVFMRDSGLPVSSCDER